MLSAEYSVTNDNVLIKVVWLAQALSILLRFPSSWNYIDFNKWIALLMKTNKTSEKSLNWNGNPAIPPFRLEIFGSTAGLRLLVCRCVLRFWFHPPVNVRSWFLCWNFVRQPIGYLACWVIPETTTALEIKR